MPFSINQFPEFLGCALAQTNAQNITQSQIDHVCFRTETEARYHEVSAHFAERGSLLQTIVIAGREISTYRLTSPLYSQGYAIELVELPKPKTGSPYPEGWEHLEFLVPLPLQDFLGQHPNLAWNTRGLTHKLNPTVSLKLRDGLTVKFHRIPLDEIIRLEQALGLEPGI